MSQAELAPRYDASQVESKWYSRWEEAGLFQPDPDPAKPVFSITIPPPNVTGSLHMGHALCFPIQDLIGRYRRLQGDSVLILPGTDHAGIATQMVVTKQLRAEGKTPADLGREAFVERVWRWRAESGDMILSQFRRLGCAFDWSRLRFTLDEGYHRAVLQVFIDWFERGIIYRGKRVVNWDPVIKTSVSDIETYRKDTRGKLYHIRYPFADGSGHATIATTRPETMLADVAVAAHPGDARYAGLFGKTLVVPLVNREIPLIADEYPDPAFGTGAVKITPAHDPNDFEVGLRHDLPMPVLMDASARITGEGGSYAGLDRYEARKRIVQDLKGQGCLVKVEDYDVPLLISERSGEPVEPLLSEEWFARMGGLAKPAIDAVRDGRVRIVPERYEKVYLDWMENLRDWNISRKLWWGHRVPVYYDEAGRAHAAHSIDEARRKAGANAIIRQDEDVLDTWFSSALWPFATMGWPERTSDLERFYPTSLLVTARDILYLWVARMVMLGMDYRKEVPFREVYIHATVLTEEGRRMSKSLGTGIDPAAVISAKGADAMRFTLLSQAGMNQEIRYSERRTDDARNFCNKIWNAARFVLMNLDGYEGRRPGSLDLVDRWLLSRLCATERCVREAYDGYDIQAAAAALYTFFWSEVCDWYIEVSKARLQDPSSRGAPQWVLVECLRCFLTMLHPVMPHITEEVYQHLPIEGKAPFLMAASWPDLPAEYEDRAAERQVQRWFEIVRAARALRAELGVPAMRQVAEAFYEGDLAGGEAVIASQAWVASLERGKPEGRLISATIEGVDLHLPVAGLIDQEQEIARLAREEERLSAELAKLEERLANPMFAERAKPEVVKRERASAEDLRSRLAKTRERRGLFDA
jgi:valyl-tRNA synthetase